MGARGTPAAAAGRPSRKGLCGDLRAGRAPIPRQDRPRGIHPPRGRVGTQSQRRLSRGPARLSSAWAIAAAMPRAAAQGGDLTGADRLALMRVLGIAQALDTTRCLPVTRRTLPARADAG